MKKNDLIIVYVDSESFFKSKINEILSGGTIMARSLQDCQFKYGGSIEVGQLYRAHKKQCWLLRKNLLDVRRRVKHKKSNKKGIIRYVSDVPEECYGILWDYAENIGQYERISIDNVIALKKTKPLQAGERIIGLRNGHKGIIIHAGQDRYDVNWDNGNSESSITSNNLKRLVKKNKPFQVDDRVIFTLTGRKGIITNCAENECMVSLDNDLTNTPYFSNYSYLKRLVKKQKNKKAVSEFIPYNDEQSLSLSKFLNNIKHKKTIDVKDVSYIVKKLKQAMRRIKDLESDQNPNTKSIFDNRKRITDLEYFNRNNKLDENLQIIKNEFLKHQAEQLNINDTHYIDIDALRNYTYHKINEIENIIKNYSERINNLQAIFKIKAGLDEYVYEIDNLLKFKKSMESEIANLSKNNSDELCLRIDDLERQLQDQSDKQAVFNKEIIQLIRHLTDKKNE